MIELFAQKAFMALGLGPDASIYAAYAGMIIAVALLMAIAGFILKGIVSRIPRPIIKRTKAGWDDILY